MSSAFEKEYKHARDEYRYLVNLFKEVCWYQFETECKNWSGPWAPSVEASPLTLHGVHITLTNNSRLHVCWPVYYAGPIREAPPLPPDIVLKEVNAAYESMIAAKEQINAPYDWAPGGDLYLNLACNTFVGKDTSSESCTEDGEL